MEGHASNGAPPSPDPHVHVVNPRSSIKADEYYYSDEELNPQVEVYGEHEPSYVPDPPAICTACLGRAIPLMWFASQSQSTQSIVV